LFWGYGEDGERTYGSGETTRAFKTRRTSLVLEDSIASGGFARIMNFLFAPRTFTTPLATGIEVNLARTDELVTI